MPAPKETTTRVCVRCEQEFTGGLRAQVCHGCRGRKARKYKISETVRSVLESEYDSTVRGRVGRIATKLGWPAWAVKRAAAKLGLARPWPADRRAWTPEEDAVLRRWQGLRSARWIGRQLGRGETSVVLRFQRLRMSRRVRDGYSVDDLCQCFGVDHHVITRWIDNEWLAARLQEANGRRMYRVDEPAIVEFLRDHRLDFDLRKVDQEWFLNLLFDGPLPAHSEPRLTSARLKSNGQAVYCPSPATIADRAAILRRRRGEPAERGA